MHVIPFPGILEVVPTLISIRIDKHLMYYAVIYTDRSAESLCLAITYMKGRRRGRATGERGKEELKEEEDEQEKKIGRRGTRRILSVSHCIPRFNEEDNVSLSTAIFSAGMNGSMLAWSRGIARGVAGCPENPLACTKWAG